MSIGYNIPTSGAGRWSPRKTRCQACISLIVLLVLVHRNAMLLWRFSEYSMDLSVIYADSLEQPMLSSSLDFHFPPLPVLSRNESFGACLMVKGDNDLLSEWIPYHYTLLPLRHLLVVTDVGNLEDPRSVLNKWRTANTNLDWWVANVSEFETMYGEWDKEHAEIYFYNRYYKKYSRKESKNLDPRIQYVANRLVIHNQKNATGKFDKGLAERDFGRHFYKTRTGSHVSNDTVDPEAIQYVAHSHLVHKQKAMITHCTTFMKERGVHWVSMYDTDEFLAINRMGTGAENEETNSGKTKMGTRNTTDDAKTLDQTYGMRPNLPPMESNATVVDIINSFQELQHPLMSCHTMPRVSFGASENFTCPGSEDVKAFAKSNFDYHSLSTLRFQEHAGKEDFSKNRVGKVFIDVSNISDNTLSMQPNNIHRPYWDECLRPILVFQQSPFYLMHYAGGWDRFQSKDDKRRGFEEWKELADVSDSTSCCKEEVYRWLPRFVDQVGLHRAKFLLGEQNSRQVD